MPAKVKNVYPALADWLRTTGTTDAIVMQRLYLTPEAYRNRLRGKTPFSELEGEKLESMTGINRKTLLQRKED